MTTTRNHRHRQSADHRQADHDLWNLPIDEPIPDLIAAEYRVGSVVIWVLIEGIPHKVH